MEREREREGERERERERKREREREILKDSIDTSELKDTYNCLNLYYIYIAYNTIIVIQLSYNVTKCHVHG